ncbi:ATP-grasp domain-containing protein [Streptomyces sp. AC602_WCS936]|uniref:ATP-grasp domain-containing protein n=1 Tax=Streptomyces sp. AC602_WCS936 TaxID=2823685 RepID=UPI001C261AB8|nr:ATP-grasp domain-containing protein [Streptomyces sp. AC602_WCS936]
MSTEPVLLVVGTGPKEYREELFRSLSRSRVWLLSDQEPTWQRQYVSGYTVIPRLNSAQVSTNITFLLEAVRKLAASVPIRGVLTFEEMFLSATCQIADEFGLPSLGHGVAENCRDKERTRQLLTDSGVRQPRFAFARTAAEAASIGEDFGYPVVLKPRGLAGSIGVIMVRSQADIETGFQIAASAARDGAQRHGGGALVEQFLAGPEIAVDSVVVDGRLEPMYIIRKRFGPEPFFEETGQTINAGDPLLLDAGLIEMLRTAHTALGIRTGMTHTEIRLTPDGPVIIEVNGRLAGDFVPHLAKLAMGLDGATIAARVACGEPPLIERQVHRSAAHQIVYADRDGTFNAVSLPRTESHPNLVATGTLLSAGAAVALPPRGYMARLGYAIVAAPSDTECEASLAAAVAEMSVDITPAR